MQVFYNPLLSTKMRSYNHCMYVTSSISSILEHSFEQASKFSIKLCVEQMHKMIFKISLFAKGYRKKNPE